MQRQLRDVCDVFELRRERHRLLGATVLPLVCSRFRDLLGTGSSAWGEVEWAVKLRSAQCLARCAGFFAWLLPRAGALRSLHVLVERAGLDWELPAETVALLQATLAAARLSLHRLRLVLPNSLDLAISRLEMPQLESVLVSAQALHVGPFLDGMPGLKQVEAFTPEDSPPTFDPACRLPPGITRLVMNPPPARIPQCILDLPQLKYLDLGAGDFEEGALDAALPHFTGLTCLALDRCYLGQVPRQLSRLSSLQMLSLHQALEADADRASFSALAPLSALTCLSISGCSLVEVPPAVVQLSQLKVLHTEGALQTLAPGPYLNNLLLLSIDWQVLFRDPAALLSRMAALRRLCICITHLAALPPWEHRHLAGAADVLAAVAGHPALSSVAVVVHEGEVAVFTLRLTEFLVRLAQCKPGLGVEVVSAACFWLTDGIGSALDL